MENPGRRVVAITRISCANPKCRPAIVLARVLDYPLLDLGRHAIVERSNESAAEPRTEHKNDAEQRSTGLSSRESKQLTTDHTTTKHCATCNEN